MATRTNKSESQSVRWQRMAGVTLLGTGALILVLTSAYYAYGAIAESKLGELAYSGERPSLAPRQSAALPTADHAARAGNESVTPGEDGGTDALTPVDSASSQAPGTVSQDVPTVREGLDAAVSPGVKPAELVQSTDVDAQPSDGPAATITDEAPLGGVESVAPPATQSADAEEPAAAVQVAEPTSEADDADSGTQVGSAHEENEAGGEGDLELAATATDTSRQEEGSDKTSSPATLGGNADSQPDEGGSAKLEYQPSPISPSYPPELFNFEAAGLSRPASDNLSLNSLPATRITIPSVLVESEVMALGVVPAEDGYAWETPKWVVGHIPTTAIPGQQGQGWYFGHLESPIKGEGNVFRRLPEIPGLLRDGEAVDVFLETAGRLFRYQVYRTGWVEQEDLRITDSGQYDITLVTCFPRFHYDKRLLVTAALVDVTEL